MTPTEAIYLVTIVQDYLSGVLAPGVTEQTYYIHRIKKVT